MRGLRVASVGVVVVLWAFLGPETGRADWVLEVEGGKPSSNGNLVVSDAPEGLEPGRYQGTAKRSEDTIEVVVFEDGGSRRLAILSQPSMARASAKRVYTLSKAEGKPKVSFNPEASDGTDVRVNGQLFTTLRIGERKPYFYPVFGPTGQVVTRHFPMEEFEGEDQDHPHQRSLWFTYGELGGSDFWASDPLNKPNPKFGTIRPREIKVLGEGAVGVLRVRDEWLDGKGKPLCEDEQLYLFSATDLTRIIDARLTLKATHGAVHLGDTKEGMFGLRVASSMNANRSPGGTIVNAEGIKNKEAWGKPSSWVDYSGPVEGGIVGIAMFDDPGNPRHPTPWHVRDYGLFAANPLGYHDFKLEGKRIDTIPEGQSLTFHYRIVLHEGSAEDAEIADRYEAFANPPKVTVRER